MTPDEERVLHADLEALASLHTRCTFEIARDELPETSAGTRLMAMSGGAGSQHHVAGGWRLVG